jgi:proteasome alpha subunit
VALIVAGIDRHGARLFQTDPSGVYIGYLATAIGAESGTITEYLEKNYKHDLEIGECVELAVRALASAVEITDSNSIEVAYATVEAKKMRKMTADEVATLLAKVPKKA